MSVPDVSQAAGGLSWLAVIAAVLCYVAGLVSHVVILCVKDWLQRRREGDRAREEDLQHQLVDEGIDPCFNWLMRVFSARRTSDAVNPYSSCLPDDSVRTAIERLRHLLGDGIAHAIEQVAIAVTELGAEPHQLPKSRPEHDEIFNNLPTVTQTLAWCREQLHRSTLFNRRELARVKREVLKRFQSERSR